jgi:hypothetical protein
VELEDISEDELQMVLETPEIPPKRAKRKKKKDERTYRGWFYEQQHFYGECENLDCSDPRSKESAMVATVNGKRMCRFCFLEGWLHDGD